MLEFLLTDANLPFTLALGLMLGIALLEGLGLLAGFDISRSLDDLLFDAEFEVETGESEVPGGLAFLTWLHIGIVPMLILLVVFLTAFGCTGLLVQSLALRALGQPLAPAWASGLALLASIPILRVVGSGLKRLFQDQTRAVSQDAFVGTTGTIVIGTARSGQPAQARLQDELGQSHYVMVEPLTLAEVFETGTEVLLVERQGAVYRGLRFDG